jgi:hypothetical protein
LLHDVGAVNRPRRHRRRWTALSLLALLAYLGLPGAHLLQRAHAMRGAYALSLCGASPSLAAKLRALPNAAPVSRDDAPNPSDDRGCQDPSAFVGTLVVAARAYTPDWAAWRHVLAAHRLDVATRHATTQRPRARGPPLSRASITGPVRA